MVVAGPHPVTIAPRHGGVRRALPRRRVYRPCWLSWRGGRATDVLLERMRREAHHFDRRSMLVPVEPDSQVLLLAEDCPGGPGGRAHLGEVVRAVIRAPAALAPEARVRAVIGDCMTTGERPAVVLSRLRTLARCALERDPDEVIWGRSLSLECLLETLDPRQASGFVHAQLAGLEAYDRAHGTDLQHVLELALDHESRSTAARAAYMHRNTFRRQLSKALDLLEVDLDRPEERLALHLALKLRELG